MRLSRRKFLAWLKAKRPDDVVGENRDPCGCPIANFYLEASGGSEIAIFDDGQGYQIDRGYSRQAPPRWAARFIRDVDSDDQQEITARRALAILS